MSYYILRQDAHPGWWRAVFVEGISLDEVRIGKVMDPPPEPVRVIVSPTGRAPSDYLELPVPVVSDAMRRALDFAGVDNVQYFPAQVTVQYVDGPPATDYWVANTVGAIACAAPPATSGAPPGSFRIDPQRSRRFYMFHLAEDRRLILVREHVAARLRAAGLQGLVLQDPETYTGQPISTASPPAAAPPAAPDSPRRTPA